MNEDKKTVLDGQKQVDGEGDCVDSNQATPVFSACLPDCDVILFQGGVRSGIYVTWKNVIRKQVASSHNSRVLVVIGTSGGDPHEAFRMMRLLQECYKVIDVVILGWCYSAGTLFALGANTIYMAVGANLGPLDVQLRKEDDLSRMSGECYRQALLDVNDIAKRMFNSHFVGLKSRSDILISTQTASAVASELTKGLLSPITQQIEPGRLGEMMRSQGIGMSYGLRLMKRNYDKSRSERITKQLTQGYPSHDTLIDSAEALALGLNVKTFNPASDFSGCFAGLEDDMYGRKCFGGPIIKVLNNDPIA